MMGALSERIAAEFQKRTKKTDGKYFNNPKRGTKRDEQSELKEDLNSNDISRQKDAVKRIIANMTVGRDVSPLFTDVVMVSRTTNMELKKLIYLYIMANAKLKPETAILAVNTFIQDSQPSSPVIIRALAIRTMLCVRVENMDQHCSLPLRAALKDESEYVRKTACIAVLKLFHANPKSCEDQGFIDILKSLLTDKSPMVVANAVVALNEIRENSSFDTELTPALVSRLMSTMGKCAEWGQVSILDFVSKHVTDATGAESIIERILPRLQHSNHAVVLSAFRCIVANLDVLPEERKRAVLSKLTPSFVSLMNAPGETQYVALRNIQLLMQKYTGLFTNKDVKVFFCHYTDPTCVKLEKLNMLLRLFNERNAQVILRELREYCEECEPVFVSKSIEALGSCAVRMESAAVNVAEILVNLAQKQHLVQPTLGAVKDVLRKYPDMFLDILPPILEAIEVDAMEDTEAKCSLIWCMGEFGEQLPEVKEKLLYFVETFEDHPTQTQLATLTSTVKFFLRDGVNNEEMLNDVLRKATANGNPDLRDRAYMYWRMVSNEKNATKLSSFVIGKKPPIRAEGADELDPSRLNELLANFNTVSAVYHKAPAAFLRRYGLEDEPVDEEDDDDFNETEELTAADDTSPTVITTPTDLSGTASSQPSTYTPTPYAEKKPALDFFDFGPSTAAPTPGELPQLLDPAQCDGLRLCGRFDADEDKAVLRLEFTNTTNAPMSNFAIQFNTNLHGLKPTPLGFQQIDAHMTQPTTLGLVHVPEHVNKATADVQIAFKNSSGTYYCTLESPLDGCLAKGGGMSKADGFIPRWKELTHMQKYEVNVPNPQSLQASMQAACFALVGAKAPCAYYSARTLAGGNILVESCEKPGSQMVTFTVKSEDPIYTAKWVAAGLQNATS